MNVVVTFAVRSELAPWLRLRTFRRMAVEGWSFYETRIAGADVIAVLTGIGASHAKEAIRLALRSKRPDAVVASGLAGALKPTYGVGDVLTARLVRSDCADQQVSSSDELLSLAVECGAKAVDSFISVNAIARTVEEKARLGGLAEAVDMESLAILTETRRSRVPAIALRSVADTSQCDLPCDFSKMVDERGRMRMWRVALESICAPQRLPALIRFAIASHLAARHLARFLDGYLEILAKSRGHPYAFPHRDA
jgi:nucleoside phosphorylase